MRHLHLSIYFRSFSRSQCQILRVGGFTLSVRKQVNFYYIFTLSIQMKNRCCTRVEAWRYSLFEENSLRGLVVEFELNKFPCLCHKTSHLRSTTFINQPCWNHFGFMCRIQKEKAEISRRKLPVRFFKFFSFLFRRSSERICEVGGFFMRNWRRKGAPSRWRLNWAPESNRWLNFESTMSRRWNPI